MSLLGLTTQIVPPVAYTLCKLGCPVSIQSELDLFIYYNLKLEQFSQYSNSLQCQRFGVQIPVWARIFAPFQTIPMAHLISPTMGIPALIQGQSGHGVVLTSWPHLVLKVNKELNYNSNLPVPPWHVTKRNLLYTFIFSLCLIYWNCSSEHTE